MHVVRWRGTKCCSHQQGSAISVMAPVPPNPRTSTPTRVREPFQGPSRPDPAADVVSSGNHGQSNAVTRRGDEKNQLCELNNRLASYIENMSRLQGENLRLQETLRRVEEKKTVETITVKQSFQQQTDALRALISDEAKQRATAQAEAKNLQKNIERVNKWNATLKEDLDRAAHRVITLETENANLRTKHHNAEIQSLQKQKELEAARKQVAEAESRVKALSIQNATLNKENDGFRRVSKLMNESHEKQIEEIRKTTESEIVEVSSRVQNRAESSLQSQIEEFRRIYEVKMNELRTRFDKEKERMLSQYVPKQSYEQVKSKAESLAAKVAELTKEISDKKQLLDQERTWSMELIRNKDQALQEQYERYRILKEENDDLLSVKESLQKELDVFRLLLEKEECRFNLSGSRNSEGFSCSSVPCTSPTASNTSSGISSGASSPENPTTRKRRRSTSGFENSERTDSQDLETVSESCGAIKIEDHDTRAGKFIVLENTSDVDQPLGRWKIVQQSGEKKAAHRFPLQFAIKANERITLWSADSGRKHCPPKDYVLKKIVFPWDGSGNVHLSTTIFDPQGKKMAKRISRLRSFSSGFSLKSRRIEEGDSSSDDDPDLTPLTLDETSCSLM